MKLTIILVRHGEREMGRSDRDQPLTECAKTQAERLGRRLFSLCETPGHVFTSSFKHARETAECILKGAGLNAAVIQECAALTPVRAARDEGHWAEDQLYVDLKKAIDAGRSVILLVGHETRLSQLILRFTGERRRALGALEAACIQAKDWQALWLGCGEVSWRYPVRNWLEQELLAKITSKMTVGTFLASANFIGLMELLIGQANYLGDSLLLWGALAAHFSAAGLFIATVYLYDRLVMPAGFWMLKPPKRPWWIRREDEDSQEKLALHGHQQEHMVRIWSWFFTPAVALSTLGVLMLVARAGRPWPYRWPLAVSVLIAIAIYVLFLRNRPTSDID